MKKILLFILFAFMMVSCFGQSVFAEDGDEGEEEKSLKYTVVVDGGLHGTSSLDGTNEIEIDLKALNSDDEEYKYPELTYEMDSDDPLHKAYVKNQGETVYTITVDDDRYYIKGIHYAGVYENSDDLLVNLTVCEDLILVAAYGMAGDLVPYTVTYVDTSGNELHAPDTFYAKDGEKVKVAAKFIDGYTVKNYKAFTGTVTKDGDPVSFEFVYKKVVAPEGEETEDVYVYYEDGTGTGGGGGGGGGTSPSVPDEPGDIIDIDDNPIPETNPEPSPTPQPEPEPTPEPEPGMTFWQYLLAHPWLLGGGVFTLGLLLWLFIHFITRRKNENA